MFPRAEEEPRQLYAIKSDTRGTIEFYYFRRRPVVTRRFQREHADE